jgi:CcmD family protein
MMEIHGKIYVVALVLAVIFMGLAMFLFYLERRLDKAEKKISQMEKDNKEVSSMP